MAQFYAGVREPSGRVVLFDTGFFETKDEVVTYLEGENLLDGSEKPLIVQVVAIYELVTTSTLTEVEEEFAVV